MSRRRRERPSGAREEVLRRIRAATRTHPGPAPVPRDYRTSGRLDVGDRLARFVDRVDEYRATVHRTDADGLPALLSHLLTGHGVRRLAVPTGICEAWLAELDLEVVREGPPLEPAALDTVDAVLTGAAVAVAETGTVVLDGGPGQGRRALTLVPDHHVCVVRAEQVVETVPEALARLEPTRPLTLVSGPSATSDIELDRVEGVHGPRVLDVVVLEARPVTGR